MQTDATAGRSGAPLLLLIPGTLVIAVFIASLAITGAMSLQDAKGNFSLSQYQRFFSDPFYRDFMWRSFKVAAYCTPITLLLGYPFAYVMARSSPKVRLTLTLVLVIQFFTYDVQKWTGSRQPIFFERIAALRPHLAIFGVDDDHDLATGNGGHGRFNSGELSPHGHSRKIGFVAQREPTVL
jgi:hypothetical protein